MQKVLGNFICRLLMAPNTEQLNTVAYLRINEECLIWNILLKQVLMANWRDFTSELLTGHASKS